jgi:hypothetical protein
MFRLIKPTRLLFALIAPALILALAGPALADPAWPTRSVRMIVPFPAGSANDAAARVFADGLAKRWGKPVVVDNKPGGDASIGTGLFASTRDDHTLLYGTSSTITIRWCKVRCPTTPLGISFRSVPARAPFSSWPCTPGCLPGRSVSWSRWSRRGPVP